MSNVIAEEGIHKFRSELNQIYWGLECSDREFEIQDDKSLQKHMWILKDEYNESRRQVIGKAIGDCVAGKNEFKNKSASKCIFFEKTLPETYERKHWNAVILYNYVHEAINGTKFPAEKGKYFDYIFDYIHNVENVNTVLKDKMKTIRKHYIGYCIERCKDKDKAAQLLADLNGNLNKAVKDIQEYVNALELWKYLYYFRISKQEYENDNKSVFNLSSGVYFKSDEKGKCLSFCKFLYGCRSETNLMVYDPAFRYDNGNLYLRGYNVRKDVKQQNKESREWEWISVDDWLKKAYCTEIPEEHKELGDWLKKFKFIKLPTEELIKKWRQEDAIKNNIMNEENNEDEPL